MNPTEGNAMSDLDRVLDAIREANENGETITRGTARTIASWYQSPGRDGIDFAQLASTGTISTRRAIEGAITREQSSIRKFWPGNGSPELRALSALRHYVRNPRLRPEV